MVGTNADKVENSFYRFPRPPLAAGARVPSPRMAFWGARLWDRIPILSRHRQDWNPIPHPRNAIRGLGVDDCVDFGLQLCRFSAPGARPAPRPARPDGVLPRRHAAGAADLALLSVALSLRERQASLSRSERATDSPLQSRRRPLNSVKQRANGLSSYVTAGVVDGGVVEDRDGDHEGPQDGNY